EPNVILRRTHIDYNLSDYYVSRHIIGLVQGQYLFSNEQNEQKLYSKVTYEYDSNGFTGDRADVTNATQHDTTYTTGFVQGRGNLTSVRRWDATDEYNQSKSLASSIGYNTAGSAIYQTDPLGHQSNIAYTDSFSDNTN